VTDISFRGGYWGGDLVGERASPARPADKRSVKMRTLVYCEVAG
jgi:hypothetical protein